jgi:hypothetical protein
MNRIVALTLMLGLAGCTDHHQAWSSVDSWFHPPKDVMPFPRAAMLPSVDVMEVAATKMPEAEEQLRDVACIEVSSQSAAELIGQSVESATGNLYLVRAVYLNRGTGKFTVVPLGRDLLVTHNSLGRTAVPMKRQALVVRLPQKPDVVYVDCGMDE